MNDKDAIAILRHFVNLPSPQRVHHSIAALRATDLREDLGLIAAPTDEDPAVRTAVRGAIERIEGP